MFPPSFGVAKSEYQYKQAESVHPSPTRKAHSAESKRTTTQWMKTSDSVSGRFTMHIIS